LEDAYINIAREEEKLLANLKENGMKKMQSMKRNSTINRANSDNQDEI